ncbi:type IV secretion protein Rhs [Scytonema hofmannii PCC 7110]|uniref:Type IV secretion protein Rhs n=1 Tax=Scytonema hofmannii PCC 7110 TaxID=128403 RepID=A0A139XC28_9CYAN|nr:VgrG-related protein [Scytonema hofmannii]KYC42250.1 type IV secretion protein Rhs [Scytonema hofmannii PCC 7110]
MPTYRALPILEIEGKKNPPTLMEDILHISVEESLHRPGMFTLIIQNDYYPGRNEDKPWRHKNLLQIGKSVKIGFNSSTTESPDFVDENPGQILEGEITAIETNFTNKSQAHFIVRGYDYSHRLHRGRYNRSFVNKTDSDIVKQIARETGIKTGTIDSSGVVHEYLFQENQTNMEFLRERAARIGFELFIQNGKLNFRKPKADKQKLTLKWLTDLHSFRVRVTSAEQVKEVEVRGWDYTQKKPIISKAKTGQVITQTENGKGNTTSNKFKGKPPTPKMILVDQPVFKPKEADTMAQALCDELEGQFIYADAKAEGDTLIRPGRVVNLQEMGQHSGSYYVTETRHTYSDRIYITEFSVRGSRGGDLLSVIAPQTQLQPGQTFLVGIVTDNQDPKGLGRVKVKFPTLTEEHNSNWARIVAPGAGSNRGIYWLPEVNDEVLVCFEHGDIHRPYIIGGVWNGKDPTPRTIADTVVRGKVRLREEKTRYGHKTTFVDEDKGTEKRGYYIQTGTRTGHCLRLNDSEQFIELETIGGHKIRLNDRQRIVEIATSGRQNISLNDMNGDISINARTTINNTAAATISSRAANINLQSSSVNTINTGGTNIMTAGGATTINAGGVITISAGGAIAINASAITLNAGVTTVTGALILHGVPL